MSNQPGKIYSLLERLFRPTFLSVAPVCLFFMAGCAGLPQKTLPVSEAAKPQPKVFIIILDALKRTTLMESLDELPNFRSVIKGEHANYPYIYFENVLVSIPSSSKPSNTTLLTGVYPNRHGVPSTLWFDREKEKIITLNSIGQRRVVNILKERKIDTLFDFARRSEKKTMAVATQVAKGVERENWIQQSIHLWGQAFMLNLISRGNPYPDGAHIDRGTTEGLLNGYLYSLTDGLAGKMRSTGDIPDLVVLHYIGMDIFTHYPRSFMAEKGWSIDEIQRWYLKEVLDPEIGKVKDFLKRQGLYENTIFFFIADHGQTKIIKHLDEKNLIATLSRNFTVKTKGNSAGKADVICMPGAGTKTIYVKNKTVTDWMTPPRLIEDVKPVVDTVIDTDEMKKYLNYLLIGQYPGERKEGRAESDVYWFFNLDRYRTSERSGTDFLDALESMERLDDAVGSELRTAYMYRRDFPRENLPDIILINKPGHYFAPDKGKYAHHGGIYGSDSLVSFVVSGPKAHLFASHPKTVTEQIDAVDMVPMAARLSGITIDRPLDGKDRISEVK